MTVHPFIPTSAFKKGFYEDSVELNDTLWGQCGSPLFDVLDQSWDWQ